MNAIISRQGNRTLNSVFAAKMTLLILCWEYPPNVIGGLSRHVNGLSEELAEQGHEVHIITAGNGELPNYEQKGNVYVHRVNPLNVYEDDFLSWIAGLNLAITHKAESLAEEITFNLIHAHDWLVGVSAIILKENLSIPLIATIHATEHGRNNGINTELQQFIHNKEHQLISHSDHVIVCSMYMKQHLISVFQVETRKITVLPNGVEISQSADLNLQEVFPGLMQKKYIFSIGRMVKEKGFETIIDAAAMAKENGQDLFFVIAGNGPMLESYRRSIADRMLEDYIDFIGYVTDDQKDILFSGCEMAVFPSYYEPFGIVALEAMVWAKPAIVSNTGGLKGIVHHMKTGMLMIPKDAASLLAQINYLLQNKQKAAEIGNKGREIVKSLYSWRRIASETGRMMEDILLSHKVFQNEEIKATPNKL